LSAGHITTRDADRLLRLVAAGPQLDIGEMLVELRELVAVDWIGYSELDWTARRPVAFHDPPDTAPDPPGDLESQVAFFWSEVAPYAPIHQSALRGTRGAMKISDFGSRSEVRNSRYYNLWMRPFGVAHILEVELEAPAGRTRTFHFDRHGGRDFTERDRAVLDLLQPHLSRLQDPAAPELTHREREVLACVARGLTNAQVAQELWLAPSTVRKHLENVYAKLGVNTRTAAVARFLGLIDAEAS
jgi:DNA-binding CsgD family transcriptional regulator